MHEKFCKSYVFYIIAQMKTRSNLYFTIFLFHFLCFFLRWFNCFFFEIDTTQIQSESNINPKNKSRTKHNPLQNLPRPFFLFSMHLTLSEAFCYFVLFSDERHLFSLWALYRECRMTNYVCHSLVHCVILFDCILVLVLWLPINAIHQSFVCVQIIPASILEFDDLQLLFTNFLSICIRSIREKLNDFLTPIHFISLNFMI